ncbi:MAG: MBOAT family protein [Lachnospiraceae bacterium]|nr:MBOAT family protein [Lachnospiraceae bacterium]
MLFSSLVFLLYFFPVTVLVYYLLSFSRTLQNVWLLIMSLIFYAWGEPVYVLLMIASILLNSLAAYWVQKAGKDGVKKLILVIVVTLNLLSLFIFKYLGFVAGILNSAGLKVTVPQMTLPIGISFYTFQALSYVVDVYRGDTDAENPFNVGLYIAFFPQLIAGPIIQYRTISDQIRNRKSSVRGFTLGLCRFVTGLGRKVLLANAFAAMADHIFTLSAIGNERYAVPAMLAWLGSIAYSLQIFYDFSAYSDMAIGLGAIFGFRFPENFNYPYIADSISDFWRRWHISLTSWFREYVYIPLGGNRVANQDYMVRNIFVVWLLTGIWHGANITFIFWGMFYFLMQLAERFFDFPSKTTRPWVRHLYSLLIINFAWVIFRADSLYQAGRFFRNMFALNNNGVYSDLCMLLLKENWLQLTLGILFCMPVGQIIEKYTYDHPEKFRSKVINVLYAPFLLLIFALCLASLSSGSYNPFIYFNF